MGGLRDRDLAVRRCIPNSIPVRREFYSLEFKSGKRELPDASQGAEGKKT
jgi:hypothetical protein